MQAHPDEEGLADERRLGHAAVVSAVLAVVAVVAHHEVAVVRYDWRIARIRYFGRARAERQIQYRVVEVAEALGQHLGAGRALFVLIRSGRSRDKQILVDPDSIVPYGKPIARQTYDSLDPCLAGRPRRAENDHDSAFGLADVQTFDVEEGQPHAVAKLVHENEIADLEGRDHRAGRNAIGLRDRCAEGEDQQQHGEQRYRPIDEP